MYTIKRRREKVREPTGRYAPEPREEFTAAEVLEDLADADASGAAVILCRYVVLRAWMLKTFGSPRPVERHARAAAMAHLGAARPDWHEGRTLRALLACSDDAESVRLLRSAALASESGGHLHGARALRAAAFRLGLRNWRMSLSPN